MTPRGFGCVVLLILAATVALPPARGAEPALPANTWQRLDDAVITGQRYDIPLGYVPALKQFLVLGGRTNYGEYRKPRPYDVLTLKRAAGTWENAFPAGQSWGPAVGPCQAPAWKDEHFGFSDAAGNTRPNWTVYGTFSLGRKYAYDTDTQSFLFYAGGRTFRYDPARREWTDLAPATHPEGQLGGIFLWSSLTYDQHNKRFLLFGGGNASTERGDPGTWSYSPAGNVWKQLDVGPQPPQRANSPLAYDPIARRVVLFGGDTLSSLVSDTWTFDVATDSWHEQRPSARPGPRAAHALLWLPAAKKTLLLGGYTYTSTTEYVGSLYKPMPFEAWIYDAAGNQWQAVSFSSTGPLPVPPRNSLLSAAVGDDDTVVLLDDQKAAWICRLDVTHTLAAAKTGQSEVRREGSHDPAWYMQDVPAPDPASVAAELKKLPTNQWVRRPTPKRPGMNMDWGSAVLDPDHDQIIRFSGGHSAYSGTAPPVYDIRTDRYSLPFAPEYPIEYVYSNDQVNGEASFRGNPWMTGHTYKSTGYDPRLKLFVFVPHEHTYFFDPVAGVWSRAPEPNPFRPNFYTNTVCSTAAGAVVWASRRNGGDGLYRLNAQTRTWTELKLTGSLPPQSPDQTGMAYDSERNRLLMFSNIGEQAGDVLTYDLQTGHTAWLDPAAKSRGAVPSREAVYLPDHHLVLLAARTQVRGEQVWLAYDCRANAWVGLPFSGDDPIGKGTLPGVFHNSVGLMYDPPRRLLWAVGQHSEVFVLHPDDPAAKPVIRLE